MHEETIPEALHAQARRLTEEHHGLGEQSQLYAQADEQVAAGNVVHGVPVRAEGAKRAVNWALALQRYENFWTERGVCPRENTRNRSTLPDAERRLGEWARYQRRFEENLCPYQIIRLDLSSAYRWDPHDHAWQKNLDACSGHFRSTGQLPHLNGSDSIEFALARWLGRQLRQLHGRTLEPSRSARLSSLLELRNVPYSAMTLRTVRGEGTSDSTT